MTVSRGAHQDMPFFQAYRSSMTLRTRGAAPENVLVDQARARIAALDPELPLVHATPLAEQTQAATVLRQFMSAILFIFGAGGMALVALGIYGAGVVHREAEHARNRDPHGARRVGPVGRSGIPGSRRAARRGRRRVGMAAAFAVSRLLSSLLFGVSATDIVSFARAGAIVLGGGGVVTLVPAWRAAGTNVLTALRHQ